MYPRYVRALSWAERDALWRDYKVVGNLFGLADADMPDGIDEFDAYMQRDARRAAICSSCRRRATSACRSS